MVKQRDKRENSVYLSLGTNLGDRMCHLQTAIDKLSEMTTTVVSVSPIYESEPWGKGDLNAFLNCVVQIKTDLEPFYLLAFIQRIEKELGRLSKSIDGQYQNRVIDIDILTYNYQTFNSNSLQIPHPFLSKRRFVLLPFSDIAGGFYLPYSLQSVGKLLELCEDKLVCKRL